MLFKCCELKKKTNFFLDGIDGKQARRTGSSGPLGELFDHGLDSYTAALIPLMMFSIFGSSKELTIGPLRMFYVLWNVLINFHLSHWEKYNTGLLFLPWGYDISMWMTILVFLATGVRTNTLILNKRTIEPLYRRIVLFFMFFLVLGSRTLVFHVTRWNR